jgi:hypothetical protein
MAVPLYNISLAMFYLLTIKYNWQDQRLRNLEKYVHGTICTLALVSAIIPIPLDLYNPCLFICWINNAPYGCEGDKCIRGAKANKWELAYTIFPIWISIVLSFLLMGMIYCAVRAAEQRTSIYTHFRSIAPPPQGEPPSLDEAQHQRTESSTRGRLHRLVQSMNLKLSGSRYDLTRHDSTCSTITTTTSHSGEVATQALWYIGAFLITFVPDTISTILYTQVSIFS